MVIEMTPLELCDICLKNNKQRTQQLKEQRIEIDARLNECKKTMQCQFIPHQNPAGFLEGDFLARS